MSLLTNLIGYWKKDEASGNALDAHGTNDLTDNAAVGSGVGKINNARDFEVGSLQYFNHVDNADLSLGDIDFTYSAWVNFESLGTFRGILSRYLETGNQRSIILEYDGSISNTFRVRVSADGTTLDTLGATTFGAASISTWYFVVTWHDSVNNILGISVNDVSDTVSRTTGVFDGTADFEVGREGEAARHMDGLIDEVGFWKRVLTAQERTDLYNSGNGLAYENFGGAAAGGINMLLARTVAA